ncbi:MAG: DUF1934 domain-containing protein [Oscillospiraceae bacterium]|nr:DUF1934 domain-containing protein [Oscillospiraceae bacterium]
MEKKEVIISITGIQSSEEGEKDAVELSTDGEYCFSEEEAMFSYMESELTGLEGTKTSFSVGPGGVVMSREGSLNSRMIFEEGKKHLFLYETPVGAITMGVKTRKIMSKLGEHGGDVEIDYVLDFDHVIVGHNKFRINVREQGAAGSNFMQ